MTAMACLVDGQHLWCSSGAIREGLGSFEKLCSSIKQECHVCGASSLVIFLPGLWKHRELVWTPRKDLLRPLKDWQKALDCSIELLPLSMLAQSTGNDEGHLWLWLGDSLDGALVTPRNFVALPVGHWPLLEDRQCRCGGRSHADAFGSVDALRRSCDSLLPGQSLEKLWEHREESLLAPIWGRALRSLASVVVTALSIDASLSRCLLCGPLAELDDFADELGDVVYPLLSRQARQAVELSRGPATERLLKNWKPEPMEEMC